MNKYNLANIRALLIEGFSEEELRLLCYDAPNFRPVYPHLPRLADKAEIVQRLLEYAEQQMQLEALLEWAKEHNPDRFEEHQPYYEITPASVILSGEPKKSQPEVKPVVSKSINDPIQPTIGIITALPKEYAAVNALLENSGDYEVPGDGAGRRYRLGTTPAARDGQHEVVLSLAIGMGNNFAATQATLLLEHFPSVTSIIMVGIAGGVPYPEKPDEHVRLGDIVISNQVGVIQYDFDKETRKGGKVKIQYRHPPRPPSPVLLESVRRLEADELTGQRPWLKFIKQAGDYLHVSRPSTKSDLLASSVNLGQLISHPKDPKRKRGEPRVFIGPIASADKLLKNPGKRDDLRNRFGIKAVEMEGAGIADATWSHKADYLVVRGICDYCDANKGDDWQNYAAIVAAAYTRALLESMPGQSSRIVPREDTSSLHNTEVTAPSMGQLNPPFQTPGGKKSSRKPDAPKLQPVLYPGSQISAALKGYDPFRSHLAEDELSFLFGETGGFWSQHPIYISVSASISPEVILVATGGGKTAFAQALIQLGTSEGQPLPQTLPVFIEGRDVTFQKIQTEFTRALLKLARFNPVRFQNLGQAEKRFLLHSWLQRMKPDLIEVQLKSLFEIDPSLIEMMGQVSKAPRLKQKEWQEQSRQCLQILGFDRTFLVIDFNQQNTRGAPFCLQQIQNWATDSIMMKLFLPAESRQDFSEFLNRIKTLELTWSDEQLAQMIQWRFESLSRLTEYHGKPEVLFDNDLYSKFIQQAGGNPRRLAILWRNLFEDHLQRSPLKRVFSPENFNRAVEKLT